MGIRLIHVHDDGKECFRIASACRNKLSKAGLVRINGKVFAVAYMVYTGGWYAYDIRTGREIAHFHRDFYDQFVAPSRFADFAQDDECDVVAKHTPQLLPTQA